ncbi:hypothetical protein SAMN06265222_102467 [Neorhodopirellula lusitana]|uniref:Lipoprotein n=1 Tax=Neorhodopirellula lusitana TaxID=445327 RepID=A0ABY1PVB1_9BACT|nr:hypothetical protein [Neorhodopirellula lusitana]SMP48860.1 hypothetical protein SAMN06265222_102467 [Neorhodopirellula lusitana]
MAFSIPFIEAARIQMTARHPRLTGCLAAGVLLLGTSVGCGKKEVAENAPTTASAQLASVGSAEDAEAVVSQFLDRIRRGGENHDAMSLLTDRAQSELKRVGQVVQPIGSPDARFTVTRSTPMPADPATGITAGSGRLVHCIWSEPNTSGNAPASNEAESYQVVWSVVMQGSEYKISGLILEMDPNQPPLVLDFENGDLMAQVLGGQPEARTAQNPDGTTAGDAR